MAKPCTRAAVSALLALGLSAPGVARAQVETSAPSSVAVGEFRFVPKLEIRTRGEYRRDPPDMGGVSFRGTASPRVRDALAIHERTRLGVSVERPYLRADVVLQDARVFGASQPFATFRPDGGFASFGAYEAFVEAHTDEFRPTFVRLGRQSIAWGDGLLLGTADASPTGRALDAVRFRFSRGAFEAEAIAVVLDTSRPLGLAFDDGAGGARSGTQLYGLRAGFTFDPKLVVEAFGFARVARSAGSAPDGTRFAAARAAGETYTAALRVGGDDKGIVYAVNGALQLGSASALGPSGVERLAFALEAHVAKRFEEMVWRPTIRIGGAYASGDEGGGRYTQFDPLLPDVNEPFGAMSLFAWSNLVEGRAKVLVEPRFAAADVTASLEYHYLRTAQKGAEWLNGYLLGVGGFRGQPSNELGHELDALVAVKPWPWFDVGAGYSVFVMGDAAKNAMAERGRGVRQANGTVSVSPVAHLATLRATLRIP